MYANNVILHEIDIRALPQHTIKIVIESCYLMGNKFYTFHHRLGIYNFIKSRVLLYF